MKFCDLRCEHARWPDQLSDGSRSCMTFTALYCEKLERLVHKNSACQWEHEQTPCKPKDNIDKPDKA